MSQDGHVFRLSEIEACIANLQFNDPNSLEAAKAGQPIDKPYLMCDPDPFLVNLALNRVHDTFDNRHGNIPVSWLHQRFLQGWAIDLQPIVEKTYNACHIETQLRLYRDSRARLWKEQLIADLWRAPTPGGSASGQAVRPKRAHGVSAYQSKDEMRLVCPGWNREFLLNSSARTIWKLCDGERTVGELLHLLRRSVTCDARELHADLLTALRQFHQLGLIALSDQKQPALPGKRRLDLRDLTFYVINCKDDDDKKTSMETQLRARRLKYEFVTGIQCESTMLGKLLSHLKVLRLPHLKASFIVLEDDVRFADTFQYVLEAPGATDAIYLGVSQYGLEHPGVLSWGVWANAQYVQYDDTYLRILNMLSRHAILYLSERYRQSAIEASLTALFQPDYYYPGDVAYATLQLSHVVLTPHEPMCYQDGDYEWETKSSLVIETGATIVSP